MAAAASADGLYRALRSALIQIDDYSRGNPWYALESMKCDGEPGTWLYGVNELARSAGWSTIVSDDGASKCLVHPGTGETVTYVAKSDDRSAGQMFRDLLEAIMAYREDELTSQRGSNGGAKTKFDPEKYRKHLSTFEIAVLNKYCDGVKPGEIASAMNKRNGAKRGIGKHATAWEFEDTERTIRAAKKAGFLIKRASGHWKIVTCAERDNS